MDDLKLPLPEVEKRLGSSAKGLSQAEAQKRLAQCGPRSDLRWLGFLGIELEEKHNAANTGVISAVSSRVVVRVIRTN